MTERQEVAEKLRENSIAHSADEALQIICKCTVRAMRGSKSVMEVLADLIDPTCHMEPNYVSPFSDPQWFTCDKCGNDTEQLENYCPYCGARVVIEDA